MKIEDAKQQLKIGTIIMWNDNSDDTGTITELSLSGFGFFVEWKNGQQGWLPYIDTQRVSILKSD